MTSEKEALKREILEYIVTEMEKGHSLETLKKVLIDIGHDPKLVNDVTEVKQEHKREAKATPKNEYGPFAIVVAIAVYLMLILFLSASQGIPGSYLMRPVTPIFRGRWSTWSS